MSFFNPSLLTRRAWRASKPSCIQRNDVDTTKLSRYMTTGNSAVGVGGTSEPNTYCRELVRKHDYEAYLCSYFYPRAAQPGYFALRAFDLELAMIREAVSRPVIGKLRMQFWRDTVKLITDNKPVRHPIAIALHEASQKAKLPPYYLKRMIDARDEELDKESYMTVEAVTQYAESASSTLLYLLLSLLHQSHSDTLAHASSHVGIARSLATLLRALPFHATRRRMIIPVEITAKHGVRQEEVFRMGGDAQGIADAVFEFATVANDHILTARSAFKDSRIPSEAMPVFLSAVPVVSFLSRLEEVNFDAFAPQLQAKSWRLPLSIWSASRARMF